MKGGTHDLWQVWRRAQGGRGAWERVPGVGPLPKADAFQARLKQEWIARDVDYDYEILPEGLSPNAQHAQQPGGPFFAGYRTKVMKPR